MRIKIRNIDWDVDDINDRKGLPKNVTLELDDERDFDKSDPDECLADMLSDEYGFCVNNFDYEIVK